MAHRILPLLVFVALFGLLAFGLGNDPRRLDSPLVGKPAPAFELPLLSDADRRLHSEVLRGAPYLLNVWASWCGPCREEHPVLLDLARELAREKVTLVGLNHKDARADAQVWLRERGDPYRWNLADEGAVGLEFGVAAVPETFVVDAAGVIRLRHVGALTPEVVERRIRPLLRELRGD